MHNTIYIFNPEHDMAMASSSKYYMIPAHIVKMKSDLSILPLWYSDISSYEMALVGNEQDKLYVDYLKSLFPCFSSASIISSLEGLFDKLLPWGWDLALLNNVLSSDLCLSDVPTEEAVEKIRQLSSRCKAVELLSLINESQQNVKPESFCFSSLEEIRSCFELK